MIDANMVNISCLPIDLENDLLSLRRPMAEHEADSISNSIAGYSLSQLIQSSDPRSGRARAGAVTSNSLMFSASFSFRTIPYMKVSQYLGSIL